jgi:hypothetical protein
MKSKLILGVLTALALASPLAAAQSCDQVKAEFNAIVKTPATPAFKTVGLDIYFVGMGMGNAAAVKEYCGLYDQYITEITHKFALETKYVSDCHGYVGTVGGQKISNPAKLEAIHQKQLDSVRKTHAEACASQ